MELNIIAITHPTEIDIYNCRYAVTDLETSGGTRGNRITEIAIVIVENGKIVNQFTHLVNPQTRISKNVSLLTGITQDMVADQPTFEDLAEEIMSYFTPETVFVAHNVNFDYHILKNHFAECDIDFYYKRLCSIRMSREGIPGMPSYSLGKLCRSLDIPLVDRHRAYGDALATTYLLQKLLNEAPETVQKHLGHQKRSSGVNLPPGINPDEYNQLPLQSGVYYFLDQNGEILYIGKAKSIKHRVAQHFNLDKLKPHLVRRISHISHELTGTELLAELIESGEIKKHRPPFNSAQKRRNKGFSLYNFEDSRGVKRIEIGPYTHRKSPYFFHNLVEARQFVESLAKEHHLCSNYVGLQTPNGACFLHHKGYCRGICEGDEAVTQYNIRVEKALAQGMDLPELWIDGKGRNKDEKSLVVIKNGQFHGYAFLPVDTSLTSETDIEPYLKKGDNNSDTNRILRQYLRSHPSSKDSETFSAS